MRTLRRGILAAEIATCVALAAAPGVAQPQPKFPTKPIRLVLGFGLGTSPDTLARLIGPKMSEKWGQPVVIENRPGAGGMLAAGLVARAAPDGHTLLYAASSFAISAALQPSLPYDPVKDFAAIGQTGFATQVMIVLPELGVKSVKDLIALAKAQPGKIIFGSGPTGTGTHLTGARFNLLAGIKVVHVAFTTGQTTVQTLGGRTHYSMTILDAALPLIKDGKLVALAVNTPQRSHVLPDVPALGETLPDFRRSETSQGLLAPAGTPRSILDQINKEVARILALPDVKERLQAVGFHIAPSTPEEYDKILRGQIETLSKVVRDAGLRPK